MRINKFIALHTGQSRRGADKLVAEGRVAVNGQPADTGQEVTAADIVTLDGQAISAKTTLTTIMFNKPKGYVVSRNGQGNRTVYDLLPSAMQHLKPVGRLDKHSSGLLIFTNDGALAEQLTHPRYAKQKVYQVVLNKPLQPLHHQMITEHGIRLEDGPSKLILERQADSDSHRWTVTMSEGRNRQIRRTFGALGYDVTQLHRTHFGPYALGNLQPGSHDTLTAS